MTSILCSAIRIRDLNDAFRRDMTSGQWMLTRGVADKGAEFVAEAVRLVRSFDSFTEENDPYGEHDFGSFDFSGERLFWKIDYYDPTLSWGSDAPECAEATSRVLTLMLASEY
jgi:hypothetical protein